MINLFNFYGNAMNLAGNVTNNASGAIASFQNMNVTLTANST